MSSESSFLFPGLMPLKQFGVEVDRCQRTLKRRQAQGKLVVCDLGNEKFVDLEKTAARMRGEDERPRGRGRRRRFEPVQGQT
jgi:hypothetical protein